jgi:hypothetical protein
MPSRRPPGRPRPPHFHFDVTVGRSSAEGIVEDNVKIDMADAQLPAFGSVTTQAAEHCNSDRRDHPWQLAWRRSPAAQPTVRIGGSVASCSAAATTAAIGWPRSSATR